MNTDILKKVRTTVTKRKTIVPRVVMVYVIFDKNDKKCTVVTHDKKKSVQILIDRGLLF